MPPQTLRRDAFPRDVPCASTRRDQQHLARRCRRCVLRGQSFSSTTARKDLNTATSQRRDSPIPSARPRGAALWRGTTDARLAPVSTRQSALRLRDSPLHRAGSHRPVQHRPRRALIPTDLSSCHKAAAPRPQSPTHACVQTLSHGLWQDKSTTNLHYELITNEIRSKADNSAPRPSKPPANALLCESRRPSGRSAGSAIVVGRRD